ncbi:MAG: hypothetical protein KBD31_00085 [Proteobacteria bacterium]|nr:hypothetical protein [Pseudomonadota bacterium]
MTFNLKESSKKYGVLALSTSALMLGIYSCFLKKTTSQIGVVDMKKMVTVLSKDLVKQYPTGQIPKDKMEQLIGYINIRIQLFAQKHKKVIFLNKQNMLTGETHDCTDAIIEAIQCFE